MHDSDDAAASTSVRGLRKRLYTDPVAPRASRSDCLPWLREVIMKCLEVDASQRWHSAAQLAQALQNPLQVALGERAVRTGTAGRMTRFKRWMGGYGEADPTASAPGAGKQVSHCPIVMAAVDIDHAEAGRLDSLRDTFQRSLQAVPGSRLACVCVMRTARIGIDEKTDARTGQSHSVRQLVGLTYWARPIGQSRSLEDDGLTMHVLEAPGPAATILAFAERNHVVRIVMGARGASSLRRYWVSVSGQVVAQSRSTVTVVMS